MFWLYLYFLNILYFSKYYLTCTIILHRRSPCTFYKLSEKYRYGNPACQPSSDSPHNMRVTSRERYRETTFITKMSNVEYVCTICDEYFDTEQKYLDHKDQNHLGQRWKCHLCGRYFVRRLERSLHRAEVHPYEPPQTPDTSDFVGDLRPPRKPIASARPNVHKSQKSYATLNPKVPQEKLVETPSKSMLTFFRNYHWN